jgi:FMN phosphatase YigB (HAD superfamily)
MRPMPVCSYHVGVISNHVTPWLAEVFTRSGYNDVLNPSEPMCVVSDAVQCGKPSPDIFAAALARYRVEIGMGGGEGGAGAGANDDGTPSGKELAAACVFVDNQVRRKTLYVVGGSK